MAKAIATCTCKICGNTFTRTEFRRNRTEADNWTEWAEQTFDECTNCYRVRMEKENAETAASYALPEITTGSEKQVAYATSLRNRYAATHKVEMDKVSVRLAQKNDPIVIQRCAERGMTVDQALEAYCDAHHYEGAYVALTESNARNIIDILKW